MINRLAKLLVIYSQVENQESDSPSRIKDCRIPLLAEGNGMKRKRLPDQPISPRQRRQVARHLPMLDGRATKTLNRRIWYRAFSVREEYHDRCSMNCRKRKGYNNSQTKSVGG